MDKLSITIANCYYKEIQDRIPRLRGGNAHIFNTVIDSTDAYKTNRAGYSATKNKYHFGVTNQALLSTCSGALKAENLHMIDVSKPMSYEQDKGYDGKILADNIKFQLHDSKSFDSWKYDYNSVNSAENKEGFTPEGKGSALKDFSWNETGSPEYIKNGELVYNYKLIEPANLYNDVVPFTGAGVMDKWNIQWLMTNYK